MSPETMSLVIDGGGAEGRRAGRGRAGGRHGRQADERPDPALPPAGADRPGRWRSRPTGPRACCASGPRPPRPGQTGVEMEAMTAASVAALTVYDMVKGVERGVEIGAVRLVSKTGGKSGDVGAPRRPVAAMRRQAPRDLDRRPGRPRRPAGVGRSREASLMSDEPAAVGLVLTVSDGVSAGVREDGSGDAPRGTPARRSGSRWSARSSPTTVARSRRPSATGAGRHELIVTTGGTGLTPRDVTPQATPRRHRLRGPGLAEAMRAAGRADHAAGRPVARRRRRRRPDAGRQRAGQPEGRHRVARGDRAGARPRPRDAGRPASTTARTG